MKSRESLIIVLNIIVVLMLSLVFTAAQSFPYFTLSLMGILVIMFLYILTEQWMTHDAVEFENRFWTFMAFALARTVLFCKDSPFQMSSENPISSWVIVVLFTFVAHNYDRHLRRLVLSRVPNLRRKIVSAEFDNEVRINANIKITELRDLLHSIDQRWMSSTFLNIFFLPRVLYVEHKIVVIFSEATSDELNYIIANIELALIFYKIKDHKIARVPSRTRLLNVLARDRISDLNVTAKAMLLDGLMRMKISAHPQCEEYVKNIILKTKTDDLSELKTLTDSKGDINSMHHLIYKDIRSQIIKDSILKYIAQQANIQAAHTSIGSKAGKRRGRFAWRKILSDVDDTLTSSGGSWPAGIDNSFPKKAIYPGVMSFYRELDLGVTSDNDQWDSSRVGNLVFLSARPHVYKDMSENVTYGKLSMLEEERGLYTSPTLLAGSLDTGGQFLVRGNSEPLALTKFKNFLEYSALYPEFTTIMIGDNGQGDVRLAEMVLEESCQFRSNLHRVYIHQVQPLANTLANHPPKKRQQHQEQGRVKGKEKGGGTDDEGKLNSRVCYFLTYVEAAVDAYHNNLIRASGLRRIMEEAVQDFYIVAPQAWMKDDKATKQTAVAPKTSSSTVQSGSLPNASIAAGGAVLTGVVSSVVSSSYLPRAVAAVAKTVTSTTSSASTTPISTPQRKSRSLSTGAGAIASSSGSSSSAIKSVAAVDQSKPLETTSLVQLESGEVKRELRLREINRDLEDGNEVLRSVGLPTVAPIEFPCKANVGTVVNTIFGKGIVTNFRKSDGIYEIDVPNQRGIDEHDIGDVTYKKIKIFVPGFSIIT